MSLLDIFGDYRRSLLEVGRKTVEKQIRQPLTPTEQNDMKPFVDSPQMAYLWNVSILGVPSGDSSGDDGKRINFHARNTIIPSMSQEAIKRKVAGVEYAWAGRDTSPKIFRVTFWDNESLDAYHYFQRWYFMMNDPVEKRSVRPALYKRRIDLKLESAKNTTNETFSFDGAFPTEISEVELTYENSQAFTFDVMFHFNKRLSGSNA
jgi:hypothetical protein